MITRYVLLYMPYETSSFTHFHSFTLQQQQQQPTEKKTLLFKCKLKSFTIMKIKICPKKEETKRKKKLFYKES